MERTYNRHVIHDIVRAYSKDFLWMEVVVSHSFTLRINGVIKNLRYKHKRSSLLNMIKNAEYCATTEMLSSIRSICQNYSARDIIPNKQTVETIERIALDVFKNSYPTGYPVNESKSIVLELNDISLDKIECPAAPPYNFIKEKQ